MASEHIEQKLKLLPDLPGIYIMKDINGKVIYVGKAKNLKNRVRSYFKSKHTGKTEKLVNTVADFETVITNTNKEAFLLEITLIQKHMPKFNIKLKQGTGYPYLKITNEKDPRLITTSEIENDGAYYFGPYPDVYAANSTKKLLQKIYPLRRCSGFQNRPCLYYHLHQCLGACFKEVPEGEYDEQIKKIKSFLNGNVDEIKNVILKKMRDASDNMQFELAADLRDQLKYIQQTVEKQKIISTDNTPRDIFAYYYENGHLSIQIFFVRQAKLMKREKKIFQIVDSPEESFNSFIVQYYQKQGIIPPKEILVPDKETEESISSVLDIPVRVPQRGEKKALMAMAKKNAVISLHEKFKLDDFDESKTVKAQEEIFNALGLPYGKRIEVFDHSHIQGTNPVSGMVVYEDGRPVKHAYRKFKLTKGEDNDNSADESANTKEVIYRRYSRLIKEKQNLPDLILLDGGIVELNAARDVLENQLGINIPIAGMVKDTHHMTNHLLFGDPPESIDLPKRSQGFFLLNRMQEEVHRFAITFHRKVRGKNSLSSKLSGIKGVGPKTESKLLREFKSLKKIQESSVEDIQKIGIKKNIAQAIKLALIEK